MLGKGHAVSGVTVWLTGWSWTALAGYSHPRADVLIVGSMICAGAALLPDFDHPESRIANAGGRLTVGIARVLGFLGRHVHAATKLEADRPDKDGHRTITHTLVFAVFAGVLTRLVTVVATSQADQLAGRTGHAFWHGLAGLPAAVLVFVFVRLGYAAARSALPGRQKKVKLAGGRWRKGTLSALGCAVFTYILAPTGMWWLGLAVTIGCIAHLLGDIITAAGCPVLWPLPVPSRELRYNRKTRTKEPDTRWRTWYLVGTPKWMRFRVGSATEVKVTWGIVVFGCCAAAVLAYAAWWGPGAAS